MKKLHFVYFLVLFALFINKIQAQTIYFEENFENGGTIPEGWTNLYVSSDLDWRYENGGNTNNPSVPNSRRPPSAHSGQYNALFEISDLSSIITKLVTPPINLEIAIKPELHFWYANYSRTLLSTENEKIRVYYRSVDADTYDWVLLQEILDPHSAWTESVLLIPDSVRFANVELAFEGEIGPGWGACIDDIQLIETGVLPKYLESITAIQASTNNIPTGSNNNPILRIDLTVKGNDGNLFIDTLKINPLLNTTEILSVIDVKLYFTTSSHFDVSDPIEAIYSYNQNQFVFTGLNKNIPFGYSYLWITYNIPEDSTHTFNGKKVDAKILKDNIVVNGQKYPFTDLNPSGSRTINESIFFDDLEGSNLWTLSGEFEIAPPTGLGGTFGEPDPTYAFNGINVLGTDLTGLGSVPGDYENNLPDNAYLAASPSLNTKYYKDIKLQYYQWLNVEIGDSAKIQIDLNNLNQWKTIWNNQGLIKDGNWNAKVYSIANYADRKDQLSTRFIIGPTNNTWTFSGWNVDDFAITGTFVSTDAGIAYWVSPGAGCGHVAPEPLVVNIKNFGYNVTVNNIPLGYSIDNGQTWIMDTLFVALARDAQQQFTFAHLIDLTSPGQHHIQVKTFLPNDQDNRNDLFDTTLYISPTYTLPYSENFENGSGYWLAGGSSTWEYGIPTGTIIDSAYSGEYCWATNLAGNYPNNDSSWIESPCMDFSNVEKPIFEVMVKSRSELQKDGLTLTYSIDEGLTWEAVPKVEPYDWNWYSQNIEALGTQGWDSVKTDWWMARQTLPAEVAGVNPVKFRFVFASNDSIPNEGFAIDDIRIYEAPTDAGVLAFVTPVDSCYLSSAESITITLKNFGIRNFKPSDNLITSIDRDGEKILTDTFHVSSNIVPGATVNFAFTHPVNMRDSGNYNFTAYTHIIGDSNMYYNGVSNDSLQQTIRVKGEPDYTLGPNIGTLDPSSVVLDAGSGYTDYLWNDASTNQTYNVTTADEFSVTVTNTEGCQAVDTIAVIESITDLAVININGIANGCQYSYTPALEVELMNYGDTTYHNTDTIQVGYQIGNGVKTNETITLSGDLPKNNSVLYTFSNQPDLSTPGVKNFRCFSVFSSDLDYSNDTTSTTIEIYELPTIDLGADTLYTAVSTPIVLDAGAGLKNYLWQDNSTNQTFTVTEKTSQKYYVHADDLHDCATTSDTVWIISDDWKLDSILNPANACAHTQTENITLKLRNNSSNIYGVGYTIPAKITFGGETTDENIVLTTGVGANSTFTYSLAKTIDISQIGTYALTAKLFPYFDISTSNNTYSKNIKTYGEFYVDLGEDTVVTKQADTILLDASNQFSIYTWNTGNTEQTYQISNLTSNLYKVTVTDEHNCKTSSDSVQIMAYDLGIDEIKTPRSTCFLQNTDNISFVLHNYGNDILSAGTNLNAYYNLDGSGWIEKPFTLAYNLEPNKTKIITINELLTLEGGQSYTFSLVVKYANDLFSDNDTLQTTIFEFEKPSIDLGEDIYTSLADTVVLLAQPDFANYQWQDLSKESYFNVTYPASATYNCLVNNAYGCIGVDTINIYTYDISIASIEDLTNCEVSTENAVTISIQLNSQDTLQAGDEISAQYTFMGNTTTESIVLSNSFTAASPLTYTFATPFSVSDTGNYTITCSVHMENEVDTTNNSLETNFRIGAYPVKLGDDIITYQNSVQLDAGPGFNSYLWSTDETSRTISVTNTGKYLVTVVDENSCTNSDSIHVSFLNPLYQITTIHGLADSCTRNNLQSISFVLENTGNDTIYTDSVIPISYQVNSQLAVEETYTFTQKFVPGNIITIPFATKADLSVVDEYSVLVSASFGSSLSSLDSSINTWGLPQPDLGDDIETDAEEVELDAGEEFSSYEWSTAETTQTITVSTDGDYWVKVTSEHGCVNSDTVNVHFIPVALKVSEFKKPADGCAPFINKSVEIIITNSGSRPVLAGTNTVLAYQVGEESRVNENIDFISDMQPNQTLDYTFKKKLNLAEAGDYHITFFITAEGVDNSSANFSFTIYPLPEFSFEDDTIHVDGYPYELDPKVTADSYLWSTSATTRTIIVQNDGLYKLTITGANTCSTSDSVYVMYLNGVFDEWGSQIAIYPNPAHNQLSIEIPKSSQQVITEIADTEGRIIFRNPNSQNQQILDVTNWNQGIYLVRIIHEQHMAIFRIIIE